MKHNRPKRNSEKTKCIAFVSKQVSKFIEITSIRIGNDIISAVTVVKYFGVYIDKHFNFDHRTIYLRITCFFYLSCMKKIRGCLSSRATKILVHALIILLQRRLESIVISFNLMSDNIEVFRLAMYLNITITESMP